MSQNRTDPFLGQVVLAFPLAYNLLLKRTLKFETMYKFNSKRKEKKSIQVIPIPLSLAQKGPSMRDNELFFRL